MQLFEALPQEDGQFCVFKRLTLEGIEKIPVQQCVHKVNMKDER